MPPSLAQIASRQRWLEPVDKGLDGAIGAALQVLGPRGAAVAAWLHGDPLGHPAHVMLTDVPLGAWTTALVFDRFAGRQGRGPWEAAAKGAIAVGLVGALGAAVTGLADWHRIESHEVRRIGLVHGTLNVVGAAAFAVSLLRRRHAGHGRRSALAGYALALMAAQLGGSLVYQHRVGLREPVAEKIREPAA